MEAYNEAMSSVRSSVEWLFGDTVNYFNFIKMFLHKLQFATKYCYIVIMLRKDI